MVATSPFPCHPLPVLGESIGGFERRFASCTRFEGLGPFRNAVRVADLGPYSLTSKWERFAAATGFDLVALDHMRWVSENTGYRGGAASLLGHGVRSLFLRSDRVRFCPHCLAEDRDDRQRILRQAWQLQFVSACPRHGALLVDACDICHEPFLNARKTKPWACACGREMKDVATLPALHGAIGMSLAFMRRIGIGVATGRILLDRRGKLPDPFERLGLDDLLAVAAKIGALAATPRNEDLPITQRAKVRRSISVDTATTIQQVALVMDGAYEVIRDWPSGGYRLFSALADRNTDLHTDHPVRRIFATRLGYQLLGSLRSIDGRKVDIIDDALRHWLLVDRGIYLDGRRRAKVERDGALAIDVADAMRRLEGRTATAASIGSWIDAGAIRMVGKKVLLSTVTSTLRTLDGLASRSLDDGMSLDVWSRGGLFLHTKYRKVDALRDLLAGRIGIERQRDTSLSGLAALRLSRWNLEQLRDARCASAQVKIARRERLGINPMQIRLARLEERDGFLQPGRLNTLLAKVWPEVEPINFPAVPQIRCEYKVRVYHGRNCGMRLYSVRDAAGFARQRLRRNAA